LKERERKGEIKKWRERLGVESVLEEDCLKRRRTQGAEL
jgi:hypothetical protein